MPQVEKFSIELISSNPMTATNLRERNDNPRLREKGKHGGRRAGSGRKRGGHNRLSLRQLALTAKTRAEIKKKLGQYCFDGDAHAALMAIYMDTRWPLLWRMEAASRALPYEKPRLAAVAVAPMEKQRSTFIFSPGFERL